MEVQGEKPDGSYPVPPFLRRVIACVVALGLSTLAHASGQMPILALPIHFASHQACVAALEAAYAEDAKQVTPLTVAADGTRREVTVDSTGVERLGPQLARYDATIWYHNGGLRTDLPHPQIETSHSYEHPIRQCEGKTMKTSGNRGYTLSTFEPVAAPEPPQP